MQLILSIPRGKLLDLSIHPIELILLVFILTLFITLISIHQRRYQQFSGRLRIVGREKRKANQPLAGVIDGQPKVERRHPCPEIGISTIGMGDFGISFEDNKLVIQRKSIPEISLDKNNLDTQPEAVPKSSLDKNNLATQLEAVPEISLDTGNFATQPEAVPEISPLPSSSPPQPQPAQPNYGESWWDTHVSDSPARISRPLQNDPWDGTADGGRPAARRRDVQARQDAENFPDVEHQSWRTDESSYRGDTPDSNWDAQDNGVAEDGNWGNGAPADQDATYNNDYAEEEYWENGAPTDQYNTYNNAYAEEEYWDGAPTYQDTTYDNEVAQDGYWENGAPTDQYNTYNNAYAEEEYNAYAEEEYWDGAPTYQDTTYDNEVVQHGSWDDAPTDQNTTYNKKVLEEW